MLNLAKCRLLAWLAPLMLVAGIAPVHAQAFKVQCPETTITHATAAASAIPGGGYIKCQQISGGGGCATMAEGTQTYLFSFGTLSGISDIASGKPGTQSQAVFMTPFDPTAAPGTTASNGAVGIVPDPQAGTDPVCTGASPPSYCTTGMNGHVDPRQIMDVGVMNGNIPAPMMAIDEDDEFFLTLTNVGMIMRPDLFEQHTVHFHGYPNASGYFDGVPDASLAINIGGSITFFYLAPDAGPSFLNYHLTPPPPLTMRTVAHLHARPRPTQLQVS